MSISRVAAQVQRPLARITQDHRPNADDLKRALTRPTNFGLSSGDARSKDLFHTWSLGPIIETRDSDLIELANAKALLRYLDARPELTDEYTLTTCSHWAVGHVTHLSYHAINDQGAATEMSRIVLAWPEMLAEYPIADEDLLSELEVEAVSNSWDSWQAHEVRRDLTRELVLRHPTVDSDNVVESLSDDDLWEYVRECEIVDGCLRIPSYRIQEIATQLAQDA